MGIFGDTEKRKNKTMSRRRKVDIVAVTCYGRTECIALMKEVVPGIDTITYNHLNFGY